MMNELNINKELLKSAIPLQINIVVYNHDDNKTITYRADMYEKM